MNRRTLLAATIVAAFMTGCGPTPPKIVEVEGVVTLNGKPLADAEVRFLPLIKGFGGEYAATAITDSQGRYQLTVLGQHGACEGSTLVTIDEAPLPDDARGMSAAAQMKATNILGSRKNRPIPAKYTSYAQTPLKLDITQNQKEYPLELNR